MIGQALYSALSWGRDGRVDRGPERGNRRVCIPVILPGPPTGACIQISLQVSCEIALAPRICV